MLIMEKKGLQNTRIGTFKSMVLSRVSEYNVEKKYFPKPTFPHNTWGSKKTDLGHLNR